MQRFASGIVHARFFIRYGHHPAARGVPNRPCKQANYAVGPYHAGAACATTIAITIAS
jgi:hypothetical protein